MNNIRFHRKEKIIIVPFLILCAGIYTIVITALSGGNADFKIENAVLIRNIAFYCICIFYTVLILMFPLAARQISGRTLLLCGFITKVVLIPFYMFVFFAALISLPLSLLFGLVFPMGLFAGPAVVIAAAVTDFLLLLLTSLYTAGGIKKLDGVKGKKILCLACFFYIADIIIPAAELFVLSKKNKKSTL